MIESCNIHRLGSLRAKLYSTTALALLCLCAGNARCQAIVDAVKRGDIVAVRRMIAADARQAVTTRDGGEGTALQWCAVLGRTEIAQLLIANGADVNTRDGNGWTPLHQAVVHHQFDMINLLLQHGANLEALSNDGNMPIHKATHEGGEESVAYAIVFGSDVDARNRDGNTPLAVAAWYGRADVARLLIGAGADIHSKNLAGNSPLDEALRGGQSEIATIITKHDVDLMAYDALKQRRAAYWANVRTSYANWRDLRAHTQIVYKSDFAAGIVGQEWSTLPTRGTESAPLRVSTTPRGNRKFLGDFSSQSVRLNIGSLPPHHEMAVTFDLYILRSWDGNDINSGPDIWSLNVVGGPELLSTTFANTCAYRRADKPMELYKNLKIQAYPGEYPLAHNAFCAEADEVNTLGYKFNQGGNDYDMDALYRIRYTFPHTEGQATLNFSAQGLEALDNESWGINNVEVSVDSLPVVAAKPAIMTPNTAALKPKPPGARAAAHNPVKSIHRSVAVRKPSGHKAGSTKTAAGRLHDKKKPLTP